MEAFLGSLEIPLHLALVCLATPPDQTQDLSKIVEAFLGSLEIPLQSALVCLAPPPLVERVSHSHKQAVYSVVRPQTRHSHKGGTLAISSDLTMLTKLLQLRYLQMLLGPPVTDQTPVLGHI